MTRRHTTVTQFVGIGNLLTEVLAKDSTGAVEKTENRVAYLPGWSDEAVATKIGCAAGSVRYLRQQMFGNLKRANGAAAPSEDVPVTRAEFDALQERVLFLETTLSPLFPTGT